jgi:hypothetical protein
MILRNRIVAGIILAVIAFWVSAPFLPRIMLFDLVNAVGVTLGIFVFWAYAPGAWKAAKTSEGLDRVHYLILGIVSTWVAMVTRTVYIWVWRWRGEPDGGLDHIAVAFIAFLIIIGGVLHLIAPRVLDGIVPRTTVRHMVIALVIGILLGIIIWLSR